jgi:hypothetical protein
MFGCPYPSNEPHDIGSDHRGAGICPTCCKPLVKCSNSECNIDNAAWNTVSSAFCRQCGTRTNHCSTFDYSEFDDGVRLLKRGKRTRIELPKALDCNNKTQSQLQILSGSFGFIFLSAYQKNVDSTSLHGLLIGSVKFQLLSSGIPGRILSIEMVFADVILISTTRAFRLLRLFVNPDQIVKEIRTVSLDENYGYPTVQPIIWRSKNDSSPHVYNVVINSNGELRILDYALGRFSNSLQSNSLNYSNPPVTGCIEVLGPYLAAGRLVFFVLLNGKNHVLALSLDRSLTVDLLKELDSELDICLNYGSVHFSKELDKFYCILNNGRLVSVSPKTFQKHTYEAHDINLSGCLISAGPGSSLCFQKSGSDIIVYQPGIGRNINLGQVFQKIQAYIRPVNPILFSKSLVCIGGGSHPRIIAWPSNFDSTTMRVHDETPVTDDGWNPVNVVKSFGCLAWLENNPDRENRQEVVICSPPSLGVK